MKFTVDTDSMCIKVAALKSFKVPVPEDQKLFWQHMIIRIRDFAYDFNAAVTDLRYNAGRIEFGSKTYDAKKAKDSEEVIESEFKPIFCFDLKDYKVKTLSGVPLKSDIIAQKLNGLHADESWLQLFYNFWHEQVYANTAKTLPRYMFELTGAALNRVKAAEKLYHAGFIVSVYRMKNVVNCISSECLEDVNSYKPWELLKIPECMFKLLVSSEELRDLCRYSSAIEGLREYSDLWQDILPIIKELHVEFEFMNLIIGDYSTKGTKQNLRELLHDRNYERKRLFEYLFIDLPKKQGFSSIPDALATLRDYASMSAAVYEKIPNKYPKYLKSEHDMIVLKFNEVQQALEDSKIFEIYVNKIDALEFKSKTCYEMIDGNQNYFQIKCPKSAADIVDEGKAMHHCVASYVSRVAQNTGCLILFMRTYSSDDYSWNQKETRHCTIELDGNRLVQIRGFSNRDPNAQELIFLKEWSEAKDIKIPSHIMQLYKNVTGEEWNTSKEMEKIAC